MPRYDYICPDCKHHTVEKVSWEKRNDVECVECEKQGRKTLMVRQLSSGIQVKFKGTGFHSTDYNSNGPRR